VPSAGRDSAEAGSGEQASVRSPSTPRQMLLHSWRRGHLDGLCRGALKKRALLYAKPARSRKPNGGAAEKHSYDAAVSVPDAMAIIYWCFIPGAAT
jgi:hypothetical protein